MPWWVVASDGRRWELDRPLALGGDRAELDFPEFYDAEICRLIPAADQCELEAHVNPMMFRIDGPSLVPGRVLTVTDQLALRLEQCTRAEILTKPTPADPRHKSLPLIEAMLSADPNAEDPWHVYADQLEEDGDPRADRVRQGQPRTQAEARQWIITLGDAAISIDWQHGFAWRAVVSPTNPPTGYTPTREDLIRTAVLLEEDESPSPHRRGWTPHRPTLTPAEQFAHLCQWEGARFLRELHLQLHETSGAALARDWIPALREAPIPQTLERLSFGGMRPNQLDTSVLPQLSALCSQLALRCPKLKALTVHSLFFTEHLSAALEATNHRQTVKVPTRGVDFGGMRFVDRGGVIESERHRLQAFDELWIGDDSYRAVWRSMWP